MIYRSHISCGVCGMVNLIHQQIESKKLNVFHSNSVSRELFLPAVKNALIVPKLSGGQNQNNKRELRKFFMFS